MSRAWLLLVMIVAGISFLIRGPGRLWHGTEWNDFLSPYIQSRAWIRGMDPYAPENLVKLWPAGKPMFTFVTRDAADGTLVANRGVPSPYPITSFVVLASLALVPWRLAESLWIILNLCAVGVIICGLVRIAGVSWRDSKTWIFGAFVLALAPMHTGLATENAAIFVVGLCVVALWAAAYSRENLAGILLALAVCAKPQVGLFFLLFYGVQRRWRIAWVAGATSGVIAVIAIGRLLLTGIPWLTSYVENSRSIFAPGAINDFTGANPIWFQMVNLQIAFHPLLRSIGGTNLCARGVGAVLMCGWLWLEVKTDRSSSSLLSLSTLAVISLLPFYHRSYDAALVVFPLAWALLEEHCQSLIPRGCLALIALFLLPGGALVNFFASRANLLRSVTSAWWWMSFVVAHQAWALLLLAALLLWAMANRHNESPSKHLDCLGRTTVYGRDGVDASQTTLTKLPLPL
jgi:Glycosyltransferase family 87